MVDHSMMFIYIVDASSHMTIGQWGIAAEPISEPFAWSHHNWNFGSKQPNHCCPEISNSLRQSALTWLIAREDFVVQKEMLNEDSYQNQSFIRCFSPL
jgi:hypothetical protein